MSTTARPAWRTDNVYSVCTSTGTKVCTCGTGPRTVLRGRCFPYSVHPSRLGTIASHRDA